MAPPPRPGSSLGDVVLELGGQAIDQDGNYEEPLYGRISFVHLVTTALSSGQKAAGQDHARWPDADTGMTLSHQSPQSYVSEPYVIDNPPRSTFWRRPHFPGAFAPVPQGMGRRLAKAGSAAVGLSGSLSVRTRARRTQADRNSQPGPARREQCGVRRTEISGRDQYQRQTHQQLG